MFKTVADPSFPYPSRLYQHVQISPQWILAKHPFFWVETLASSADLLE
jgi:hypothetical protein